MLTVWPRDVKLSPRQALFCMKKLKDVNDVTIKLSDNGWMNEEDVTLKRRRKNLKSGGYVYGTPVLVPYYADACN